MTLMIGMGALEACSLPSILSNRQGWGRETLVENFGAGKPHFDLRYNVSRASTVYAADDVEQALRG
jgi:hypothetical protein